jgi:hypothetical protein
MSKAQHGWNQLTGFIEVYPPDTTFVNYLPWRVLTQNSDTSISYNINNVASNAPTFERMSNISDIKIESSFNTLTDTCEIKLPRFDKWIMKDDRNINNYSIYDPSAEEQNLAFEKGSVVRVFIGYDYEEKLMFHGYISEITPTAPIVIKCEDAMWKLKQKTINKVYRPAIGEDEVRLEDFIHDVLDGTGVELAESVLTKEILFGKRVTFRNSTVARIMDDIKKRGLSVFVELGKLVIGRTYYESTLNPYVSSITSSNYKPPLINMEWNVPKGGSNLKVISMEAKTKMVTVQRNIGNSRVIQLNVCLDPNKREDVFVPAEISDSANKGDNVAAVNLNDWLKTKYKISIDTTGYSQHTATMDPIKANGKAYAAEDSDFEKLVETMFEHGKDMYFKYFDNGLGGKVTVFGDYGLQPAQSVELFDPKNHEIIGEYLLTSVSTNWGFSGYRQTCTLGIKIKDSISYIGNLPAQDVFEGSSEFALQDEQNRTA